MWPFPQSQKYLQLLFMYPTDSKWMKRAQIICSASIFIGNFVTMIMSMVFFFKFILIDIESSIGSVYQISATINSTYGCAFLFLSRHKIKHMLQSLTRIYEASEWNKCPIFRYFIAKPKACANFIMNHCFVLSLGANALLFFSVCSHHRAFFEMFENKLSRLNNQNGKHLLCHLIRFHNSTKEWVII